MVVCLNTGCSGTYAMSKYVALLQVHTKPKNFPDQVQYIAEWISANYPEGESGIVYCLTRKDTEQVSAELSQHGLACGCYHADMDPNHRETVHRHWSSGDRNCSLLSATC